MTKITKEILIETLKELARVALLSMLPIAISQLETDKFQWEVVAIAGIIAVLKAIDKGVHLYGKEKENALELGLTRF